MTQHCLCCEWQSGRSGGVAWSDGEGWEPDGGEMAGRTLLLPCLLIPSACALFFSLQEKENLLG